MGMASYVRRQKDVESLEAQARGVIRRERERERERERLAPNRLRFMATPRREEVRWRTPTLEPTRRSP
jgi:hypothetical protein